MSVLPSNSGFRAIVAFGCWLGVWSLALPTWAYVIPPSDGLQAGSLYQLVFVTAGTRDALDSDVAVYDSFVQSEAAANPGLPSASWSVIASVGDDPETGVAARDHAVMYADVPIYNTHGQRVANNGLSFWTDAHLALINYDQWGNLVGAGQFVWTGSSSDGRPPYPLGDGLSTYGDPNSPSQWIFAADSEQQDLNLHLYGLSSRVSSTTPAPEPATLALLAVAAMALAGVKVLWRGKLGK